MSTAQSELLGLLAGDGSGSAGMSRGGLFSPDGFLSAEGFFGEVSAVLRGDLPFISRGLPPDRGTGTVPPASFLSGVTTAASDLGSPGTGAGALLGAGCSNSGLVGTRSDPSMSDSTIFSASGGGSGVSAGSGFSSVSLEFVIGRSMGRTLPSGDSLFMAGFSNRIGASPPCFGSTGGIESRFSPGAGFFISGGSSATCGGRPAAGGVGGTAGVGGSIRLRYRTMACRA